MPQITKIGIHVFKWIHRKRTRFMILWNKEYRLILKTIKKVELLLIKIISLVAISCEEATNDRTPIFSLVNELWNSNIYILTHFLFYIKIVLTTHSKHNFQHFNNYVLKCIYTKNVLIIIIIIILPGSHKNINKQLSITNLYVKYTYTKTKSSHTGMGSVPLRSVFFVVA